MEETIEIETRYDKLVKVAVIISIWVLSCILMFTYNLKQSANVEYNRLVSRINTKKLESQFNTYSKTLEKYSEFALQANDQQKDRTGLLEKKRKVYTELIKTIELYDKCNYIEMNAKGSPFPFTEVAISCILLLIICGIIIMSNLTNNPYAKINIDKEIADITKDISKLSGGGIMNGGGSEMEIKARLNLLKSNKTFNHVSLTFAIFIFTTYIGYHMLISSFDFKDNLYSGRLFSKSRCYSV